MSHHPVDEMLCRVKIKKELTSYEKAEKGNTPREAGSEAACREAEMRDEAAASFPAEH